MPRSVTVGSGGIDDADDFDICENEEGDYDTDMNKYEVGEDANREAEDEAADASGWQSDAALSMDSRGADEDYEGIVADLGERDDEVDQYVAPALPRKRGRSEDAKEAIVGATGHVLEKRWKLSEKINAARLEDIALKLLEGAG
jgi:hypothetical protein